MSNLAPNKTKPEFGRRLDALKDVFLRTEGRNLVGVGFNVRPIEWDVPYTESGGKQIVEMG